jgi:hypothetical protein
MSLLTEMQNHATFKLRGANAVALLSGAATLMADAAPDEYLCSLNLDYTTNQFYSVQGGGTRTTTYTLTVGVSK